jgi:hypothetical protein
MTKETILLAVCAFVTGAVFGQGAGFARSEGFAQSEGFGQSRIQFRSTEWAGLSTGEAGSAGQVQTVNGVSRGPLWVLGPGWIIIASGAFRCSCPLRGIWRSGKGIGYSFTWMGARMFRGINGLKRRTTLFLAMHSMAENIGAAGWGMYGSWVIIRVRRCFSRRGIR